MSRRITRITRFRSFTRYAPPTPATVSLAASRWAWLLAFLLSPSTAHAFASWIAR